MAWLVVVIVLLSVSVSLAANPRREQLIAMYFDKGYPYQVILLFLAAFHGIIMSMSTLKRILRKNKRRRRRKHSSLHRVGRYIMVSWRKGICITCSSELLYASSNLHSDGVRAVRLFTRLPLPVGKVKKQVQSGYSKVCFNFGNVNLSLTLLYLYRQVVMEILRCIDPQGVQLRARRRLFRRVYRNKVC